MEIVSYRNHFFLPESRWELIEKDGETMVRNRLGSKVWYAFSRNDDSVHAELLTDDDGNTTGHLFEGSFDGVKIYEISDLEKVDKYVSTTDGFSDIDAETYEKLNEKFQQKYRKVVGAVVEEIRPFTPEKVTYWNVDFDREIYRGTTKHLLKSLVDAGEERVTLFGRRRQATTVSNRHENHRPSVMDAPSILAALYGLIAKDEKYSALCRARLGQDSGSITHLDITFYKEPYGEKMERHYPRKKNGQPYADGRYEMRVVKPEEVASVLLQTSDLESIETADNDDDNLDIIYAVFKAIFGGESTVER